MKATRVFALSILLSLGTALADEITLAILPFENSTGAARYDGLGPGLADLLLMDLAKAKNVVVVDRSRIKAVLSELHLSAAGLTKEKSRAKLGKILGAKFILTGGFSLVEGKLRINAHIFEAETGKLKKSLEVVGEFAKLLELEKDLVLKILAGLEVKLDKKTCGKIDKSPEENLHFIRGVGHLYTNEFDYAIMEFMYTLETHPKYAIARFFLAETYLAADEFQHAKIEYQRFLKEFPEDELTKTAKERLKACEAKASYEKTSENKRDCENE